MQEVAREIKSYTELNGRFDSNMLDALNGMYNYGMTKQKLKSHMESNELTLHPFKSGKIISVLSNRFSAYREHRAIRDCTERESVRQD